MILTIIDKSKLALVAAINRGHLVEDGKLDWGPFGGSFTLTPAEKVTFEQGYPGILFKGDSAHEGKENQDAKIYFPPKYGEIIEQPRAELFQLFNVDQRIAQAFLIEFGEEAFEELIKDKEGKILHYPPLWLMRKQQEAIISKMQVQAFAHASMDSGRLETYDKLKDCWFTTVHISSEVFKQLIKSKMVAVLSHKDFGNGDSNGIQLTPVMLGGYQAARDKRIISDKTEFHIPDTVRHRKQQTLQNT